MAITQKALRPQIQSSGRQAAQTVRLPSVSQNVDPNAFGAMEAEASGKAAARQDAANQRGLKAISIVADEYERVMLEQDKSMAREALAKADKRAAGFMARQMSLQGKDAVELNRDLTDADGNVAQSRDGRDVVARTEEEMEEIKQEVLADLKSARAQEMFEAAFAPISNRHYTSSAKHLHAQREVFRQNTLTANIAVNRNNYVASSMSGDASEENLANIRGLIYADIKQKYRGQHANVAAVKYREQMEAANINIIRSYIDKNQQGRALAYFDRLKKSGRIEDEMSAKAIADIEGEVHAAGIKKQAIGMVDFTVDLIPETEENYKQKQIDAIREELGDGRPELRDEAIRRLKIRHQENDRRLAARRVKLGGDAVEKTWNAQSYSDAELAIEKIYQEEHYVGAKTDKANALKAAKAYFLNKENNAWTRESREWTRSERARTLEQRKVAAKKKADDERKEWASIYARSQAIERIDGGEITSKKQLFTHYMPLLTPKDYDKVEKYYEDGGYKSGVSDSKLRTFYAQEMGIDKKDIDPARYAAFHALALSEMEGAKDVNDAYLRPLVRELVIREKEEGYTKANRAFSILDPGASTTRGEARAEGVPFMSEIEASEYTKQLKDLGLSTWGPGTQDEDMKWGLHSYASGKGPTEQYDNAEVFEQEATAALEQMGMQPTPKLLRLIWLKEAGLIDDSEFKESAGGIR